MYLRDISSGRFYIQMRTVEKYSEVYKSLKYKIDILIFWIALILNINIYFREGKDDRKNYESCKKQQ